MKTAFIFHGTAGYPEENWFPWLKKELEHRGFIVHVPQFPTPQNQTLEAWYEAFKDYEKLLTEDSIIVGHSLGGTFLLRVLENVPIRISVACLVAAAVGIRPLKNWETDKPFIERPFEWKTIRERARHFLVFQSDDDPYVSLGNGEEAAQQLGVPLHFIPNAGHFNTTAGYTEFPRLLDILIRTLKD